MIKTAANVKAHQTETCCRRPVLSAAGRFSAGMQTGWNPEAFGIRDDETPAHWEGREPPAAHLQDRCALAMCAAETPP